METFFENLFFLCCIAALFLSAIAGGAVVAALIAMALGWPVTVGGALGAVVGGLTVLRLSLD